MPEQFNMKSTYYYSIDLCKIGFADNLAASKT